MRSPCHAQHTVDERHVRGQVRPNDGQQRRHLGADRRQLTVGPALYQRGERHRRRPQSRSQPAEPGGVGGGSVTYRRENLRGRSQSWIAQWQVKVEI